MDYDAIIIGARVAGSILGTLLGERGRRVLHLDRAHFPSDTLATHFFRAPALESFRRVGVLDDVKHTAPALVNEYNYIDGHVFSEPVDGLDGSGHHLCVRRITLDEILIRRVRREAAVELREGAKVESLVWGRCIAALALMPAIYGQ